MLILMIEESLIVPRVVFHRQTDVRSTISGCPSPSARADMAGSCGIIQHVSTGAANNAAAQEARSTSNPNQSNNTVSAKCLGSASDSLVSMIQVTTLRLNGFISQCISTKLVNQLSEEERWAK